MSLLSPNDNLYVDNKKKSGNSKVAIVSLLLASVGGLTYYIHS